MQIKRTIASIGIGMISGYVGTRVMAPVSMKLYEMEPEKDREQEDRVRPGPPYDVAAHKTTQWIGLHLSAREVKQLGLVFHYGLGMSGGVMYTLLRQFTSLSLPAAGLLVAAFLSLVVDEGLTPLPGFSAPDSAYPLVTHLRGFAAHFVYGLSTVGAAEGLLFLGRNGGPTDA
jgi:uncharacterized membrane protein YagU involved in acid resistance